MLQPCHYRYWTNTFFFFSQANLKTQAFIPAPSFLKGRKDVIHFKGQMLLSTTELQLSAVGIFLLLAQLASWDVLLVKNLVVLVSRINWVFSSTRKPKKVYVLYLYRWTYLVRCIWLIKTESDMWQWQIQRDQIKYKIYSAMSSEC